MGGRLAGGREWALLKEDGGAGESSRVRSLCCAVYKKVVANFPHPVRLLSHDGGANLVRPHSVASRAPLEPSTERGRGVWGECIFSTIL